MTIFRAIPKSDEASVSRLVGSAGLGRSLRESGEASFSPPIMFFLGCCSQLLDSSAEGSIRGFRM